MRKVLLTLLCLLVFLLQFSYGQNKLKEVDLSWGGYEDIEDNYLNANAAVHTKSGIYVLDYWDLRKKRLTCTLLFYNNDMQKTKSEEIEIKYGGNDMTFEYITKLRDMLCLFFSTRDKENKKVILFAQVVDEISLKPQGGLRQILDYNHKKPNDFSGERLIGQIPIREIGQRFRFTESNDGTKISILYDINKKILEDDEFGVCIFGEDLNPIWKKEFTLPYKEWLFYTRQHKIDNNGDLYILAQEYKKSAVENIRKKPNYKYKILVYTNKGEDAQEYLIDNKEYAMPDLQINLTNNQDLVCVGFYYAEYFSSGHYNQAEGSFISKLDGVSKEIAFSKFNAFGENINKNSRMNNNQIVIKDNGDICLIGEDWYWKSGSTSGVISVNVYNNIIIHNLSVNGDAKWLEIIPKRQHSENDNGRYSSYFLLEKDNNLYFTFNDNADNLKYDGKEKPAIYKPISHKIQKTVAVVKVDAQGESRKAILYNSDTKDVELYPENCKQLSENIGIICTSKKKTQKLAKITINQ